MGKLSHFLFALCFVLFISVARSDIEVNTQLHTNVSCTPTGDECPKHAFCNSVSKCQCDFGFSPNGAICEHFACAPNKLSCSELYHDTNSTCLNSLCQCFPSFKLDANIQKCELETPNIHRLGESCVAQHQCGRGADCTTKGECRCPIGFIEETKFTCTRPTCTSDEFCKTSVTPNTVCKDGYCQCPSPYFGQDNESFKCVRVKPDPVPLNSHCPDSNYCGNGAACTTGSEQVCKCKHGHVATTNTECEPVRCSNDDYCHKSVSSVTTCANPGDRNNALCVCMDGYYVNPQTLECSPEAPIIGHECWKNSATGFEPAYKESCSRNAFCNTAGKCECDGGKKPLKERPWECE